MEFVELRRLLKNVKVEHVTEVRRLAILVSDVSKFLVNLGMPQFPGIPHVSCMGDDILEAMGIILEHLWEANASGHGPWD
jgi:hypothetical protein